MKKLTFLLLILTISIHINYAQDCEASSYTFNTQQEIDDFGANFPDCHDVYGSVVVKGEDIVNLNGLSQIKSVNWHFEIRNTSLINLDGLDSLQSIRLQLKIIENHQLIDLTGSENLTKIAQGLVIRNNNNLSSLDGLQNVTLSDNIGYVTITDCPSLGHCQIENLCDHLANYGSYVIGNNGENCKNSATIIELCSLPEDAAPRLECYYDGFENWAELGLPINWEGSVTSFTEPNIEKVSSLVEGEHSMLLRSNIPFFEGNKNTRVAIDLPENEGLIDISFTYKCLGEGTCKLNLGQSKLNSFGANRRNIWNVIAGDTGTYTILLQNIEVNPPFDFFKYVQLEASPIWTGVGSYGVSEFIIDNFLITKKESITPVNEILKEGFKIYPNPATSHLVITTTAEFDQIIIYNNWGQIIKVMKFSQEIDIDKLDSGVYVIVLKKGNERGFQRFVKI